MKTEKDIITLPNPRLRERSKKVGFVDEKVMDLVQDMADALLDWESKREHEVGVALAAVQIDVHQRVVIVRNDFDNKDDRTFLIFINPEITKYEGKLVEDYEGCLSVRDVYGKVPRYEKVRVKALDQHGKEFRITLEGFLARIMQHEIDHTNGIVFVDHIKDDAKAFYHLEKSGKLKAMNYDKDIKNSGLFDQ
jgi:peptide deformylase